MTPIPRDGKCLQCGNMVAIRHGDASQKAFKCDKCRIAELEVERDSLRAAICIHIVEETVMDFYAVDSDNPDNASIAQFLHAAAELMPDLAIANKLWAQAALLESE